MVFRKHLTSITVLLALVVLSGLAVAQDDPEDNPVAQSTEEVSVSNTTGATNSADQMLAAPSSFDVDEYLWGIDVYQWEMSELPGQTATSDNFDVDAYLRDIDLYQWELSELPDQVVGAPSSFDVDEYLWAIDLYQWELSELAE
jgi:hypothetical protein